MKKTIALIFIIILAGVVGYTYHLSNKHGDMQTAMHEEVTPAKHAADDLYQSIKSGWNKMLDLVAPSDDEE